MLLIEGYALVVSVRYQCLHSTTGVIAGRSRGGFDVVRGIEFVHLFSVKNQRLHDR